MAKCQLFYFNVYFIFFLSPFFFSFFLAVSCRASLMTGRYASHVGLQHSYIDYGSPVGLPLKFKTIGNHMQEQGYATHMVGKVRG